MIGTMKCSDSKGFVPVTKIFAPRAVKIELISNEFLSVISLNRSQVFYSRLSNAHSDVMPDSSRIDYDFVKRGMLVRSQG